LDGAGAAPVTSSPPQTGLITMADTSPTLTQETHDRLVAELDDLTTRGRIEIAKSIEAARALGDLSENGDYHAAKDAQGKMEARIRQLQSLLKTADILDGAQGTAGTVRNGVVVALRYEGDADDDVQRFFVGSIEERGDLPVASPSSPLGQALLGHKAGDSIEYAAPGGKLKVTVVAIDD
jgi:transcription elongation factor GreA